MALFLREQDVADLLTMREALQAVEKAFREQGQGRAPNQPRRRVRLPQGVLHVMAGAVPRVGPETVSAAHAVAETQADVKPVTRAEDVARRAQEFLRLVAAQDNPFPFLDPAVFAPRTPQPVR